jgi:hypothetical protein
LVRLSLFGPLYHPRMMDDDECGAVGRMIDRRNRSIRREPVPVPLRTPQIPHVVTQIMDIRLHWNCTSGMRLHSECRSDVTRTFKFG